MPRYIDADAMNLDIDLYKGGTVLDLALAVIKSVKEAPTADVVPKSEVDNWYQLYHSIKEELKQEKMYHRETDKLCDRYYIESQHAKRQVAREIFEDIFKTMNSIYSRVQRDCVGRNGDDIHTIMLVGKLNGIKYLGDEIAELKKKYQIESTEL